MGELFSAAVVPFVSSLLTGAATFVFTRRKYVSEVKTNEIENMRKSLQFYIDMVEDNKKRIDTYQAEIEQLRSENTELRKNLQELSMQIIRCNAITTNHTNHQQ